MPGLPSSPTVPWLGGLIACAGRLEAQAVRTVLAERHLVTRRVPAGPARLAWTCARDGELLGIVVSGGDEGAARQSAAFWMPRARRVVLLAAGGSTGLIAPPATVVDGDPGLAARARAGRREGDPPAVEGRIAAVHTPLDTEEARRSLAGAGIAAVDAECEVWREAARMLDREALVIHGLSEPAAPSRRLAVRPAPGAATVAAARCAVDALPAP